MFVLIINHFIAETPSDSEAFHESFRSWASHKPK